MKKIEVVAATRLTEDQFWSESALGKSLLRMRHLPLIANVFHSNSQGLPTLYNGALAASDCEDHVLFIHDDVWIEDHHLLTRLGEAFQHFDVVGIVGNRRVPPVHIGWCFLSSTQEREHPSFLSGAVAHGNQPFATIDAFGPTPAPCELLDGLFIAVSRKRLIETGTRFDPQFGFHFYDLDFCRTARKNGLRVGTWPIAVTHQSSGSYGSESWVQALDCYRRKWAPEVGVLKSVSFQDIDSTVA